MSNEDNNLTDVVAIGPKLIGIKESFYFVLVSIIKDIINIVKWRCTDENKYDFEDLRKYVGNLSDGVKCRLLNTSAKNYFNKRFHDELLKELKPIDHKLHLLDTIEKALIKDTPAEVHIMKKIHDKEAFAGIISTLTEQFIELCRWHIWHTLFEDPEPTEPHRRYPSLNCQCSVEVFEEIKKENGELTCADKEDEIRLINSFASCLNNCKCVDPVTSNKQNNIIDKIE